MSQAELAGMAELRIERTIRCSDADRGSPPTRSPTARSASIPADRVQRRRPRETTAPGDAPPSRYPRRGCNLGGMEAILSVLQVIIAVVMIFLVLMHSGKDTGLSGAFGVGSGAGPLGGGSMVERNLNRWTVFFAILFVLNTIVLLKKPWA
jgi:preprotein translocase subunit SecG